MAPKGIDSTGCDWREVESLWSRLTDTERVDIQKRINSLGKSDEPFHKRLSKTINEYRKEKIL